MQKACDLKLTRRLSQKFMDTVEYLQVFGNIAFFITKDDRVFVYFKRNTDLRVNIEEVTAATPRLQEIPELAGQGVITISCGYRHVLACTRDGRVYGWGSNFMQKLGLQGKWEGAVPEKVGTPVLLFEKDAIDVRAGVDHSMALFGDGRVFAWGQNDGRLGLRSGESCVGQPQPVPLPKGTKAVQIGCGNLYTAILLNNGNVLVHRRGDIRGRVPTPINTYLAHQHYMPSVNWISCTANDMALVYIDGKVDVIRVADYHITPQFLPWAVKYFFINYTGGESGGNLKIAVSHDKQIAALNERYPTTWSLYSGPTALSVAEAIVKHDSFNIFPLMIQVLSNDLV